MPNVLNAKNVKHSRLNVASVKSARPVANSNPAMTVVVNVRAANSNRVMVAKSAHAVSSNPVTVLVKTVRAANINLATAPVAMPLAVNTNPVTAPVVMRPVASTSRAMARAVTASLTAIKNPTVTKSRTRKKPMATRNPTVTKSPMATASQAGANPSASRAINRFGRTTKGSPHGGPFLHRPSFLFRANGNAVYSPHERTHPRPDPTACA